MILAGPAGGWTQVTPTVAVSMDCREGIGLIPSLWRGGATSDGELPKGIDLKTVRLGPDVVQKVWGSRLDGGEYSWTDLDSVLDTLSIRKVKVILSLPVPGGEALDDLWPELVYDLAHRTHTRVNRFEIFRSRRAVVSDERYLSFYESAVWAIYRADRKAKIGGPGTAWPGEGQAALVTHCEELDLPLHFLSWSVQVRRPTDLTESARDLRTLTGRHKLRQVPDFLISRWQPSGQDTVFTAGLGLSALKSTMDLNLQAVCLDLSGSNDVILRAFGRLGGVRVNLAIDEHPSGLRGIGSLEGEDALALLWGAEDSVSVDMNFAGIAWGSEIRIRRSGVASKSTREDYTIPMADPAHITFSIGRGEVSLIWLQVIE